MTWTFLFVVSLFFGLAIGTTSRLLCRLSVIRLLYPVTVPSPEHLSAVINVIAQRASLPLLAFGIVGLVLLRAETQTRIVAGLAAALLAIVVSIVVVRRPRVAAAEGGAVVVREIPAGGFGQVQVVRTDRAILFAAKSADGGSIPAGAEVVMVDCESSVLTVRRAAPAETTA